jgi:GT2 family glycosyltransferase
VSTDTIQPHQTHADILAQFSSGQPCDPLVTARELAPGLCVVVCTYKRAESVSRLLDSLAEQERTPEQLLIVDASPDDATERMLKQRTDLAHLADTVQYFRVTGTFKGLTRQRNFALRCVGTDMVAFFDDDIVLLPGCLRELEHTYRAHGEQVVGVGACIKDEWQMQPNLRRLWNIRRSLRSVPSLQPGVFHRSGMQMPWGFLKPTDTLVEGDWLHGCAMMWRTSTAREIGFYEGFGGYAQGEDLEFSLRARRHGTIYMNCAAQVLHLHEPAGRPDSFKKGYMMIYNRYHIHRRGLPDRTWRDVAWFAYAWSMETLLLARHLAFPNRWLSVAQQVAGRFKAALDIVRGR